MASINVTPEQYMEIRDDLSAKISKLYSDISEARAKADESKIPTHLRPATSEDIIVDAVIWYPERILNLCSIPKDTCIPAHWCIVEEVLHPNDAFKAYMHDGCRYGLDNAYIEIKED